ncbi:type IV secretory system conjugative DNA transfer family protein [Paenarthrobacter ureafaciens]|uniref:type IV secretory system conjugative DNA transfer family protein n=1 Tax=Paenarthrobacter ureafaciens TaxID=37931 RepID=UPI00226D636D|nr:type IV secretory system conjugative DNA transfer family protein [Paenarthrobacter ureafaciens]MCY0975665.1 TraM recognition domain-containing protein [Paenarthrobacter ureafaciens]
MGAPTRARYLRQKNRATIIGAAVLIGVLLSVVAGLAVGGFYATGTWAGPQIVVQELVKGPREFSGLYIAGMGTVAAVIAAVIVGGLLLARKASPKSSWVDPAARHMAAFKEVKSLSAKVTIADNRKMKCQADGWPGFELGKIVPTSQPLYANAELVGLIFAGPRAGKSASYAVPFILDAPGAVIVTENKRFLTDATRDVRAKNGGNIWVFDPQRIVGEAPGWWWNPLSMVHDAASAWTLADTFAKAEMESVGEKGFQFFELRATQLLRGFFLAAAVKGLPLSTVQEWISDRDVREPEAIAILNETRHVEVLNQLASIFSPDSLPERSGVFSTAQIMTECLTNHEIARWVNPVQGDEVASPEVPGSVYRGRRHFNPAEFVRSKDTLYSLSKDSAGGGRALVTAMAVAVLEAAVEFATECPGGRLPVPLSAILDEAANVCRWSKLPKEYSHFGSRGILVATILQSYSQGESVWGEKGMEALYQAANWVLYLGGNKPGPFLSKTSEAVGDYYYTTPGSPGSKDSPRGPAQEHRDRIFDVAELAALPKGRGILITGQNRAALVKSTPWMWTKHKEAVEASLRAHDPQAERTIQDAVAEAESVRRNPDMTPVAA